MDRDPRPGHAAKYASDLANVPAVLLGDGFAHRIPLRLARLVAAAVFAVLGALVLVG